MTARYDFSLDGPRSRHVHDDGCEEVAQVEALVGSVVKCCETDFGVLAELQRLEGSSHCGLETAKHGLDPFEVG